MPPTAHAQLAVRVFIQETTALSVQELNMSLNNVETGLNETVVDDLRLNDIEMDWSITRENNKAKLQGFDLIFNDNGIPMSIIAVTVTTVEDIIFSDKVLTDSDDVFEVERTEDDTTVDAEENFGIIDEEDVVYSVSAKGDVLELDRPLLDEFIGVGALIGMTTEIEDNLEDAKRMTGLSDIYIDSVSIGRRTKSKAIFLNTGRNSIPGEIMDPLLDALDNQSGLLLVGKVTRS